MKSKRAKPATDQAYTQMLMEALESGTPESFARAIWNAQILRPNKDGRPHANAHETLAGGEFVRYYLRGLCLVAEASGVKEVEVYRAKAVAQPREKSEQQIGRRLEVSALLADLRTNMGDYTMLGVPAGPNSGLCARLPAR